MKILVITQYFYPETFRVNILCKELVKRGHAVTVLTGYPQYPKGKIYEGYGFKVPYEKKWNGVKIERIKMRPRGKTRIGLLLNCLSFVYEGKKWVKRCKQKYDVVYVFEVSPVTVGLPAVAYKRKFSTPIFFNVQDLWPENVEVVLGIKNKLVIRTINKIVNKIYTVSDVILCASKGFVKNIAARGVPKEKLIFWPQFCEQPDFNNIRKPRIYSEDTFNIVFAGNIGDAQGLDLLVQTAEKMKDENVKWYIVGDGRAKENLQNEVKVRMLSNKVVFVGKVSEQEANNYIYFADCAYLSFKDNKVFNMTIPAKLQTYMACGTPILAAAEGESTEIIMQAKCGIAVPRKPGKLREAINKLRRLDSKEKEKMRSASQAYFRENFSKDLLVSQIENLFYKYACKNK